MRTKCNRMDLIRNLNVWGNDLSELPALRHMPNLEVLSLSVNKVSCLEDIRYCPKLTELYLRKNNVADLGEVRHLRGLRQLKVLWLSDNPCASHPQYRPLVLHLLPSLVKLDETDVSVEEARQAAKFDINQVDLDMLPDIGHEELDFEPPTRRSSGGIHSESVGRSEASGSRQQQMQDDVKRTRSLPSGALGRSSPHGAMGGGYEDQQLAQADFHIQQGQSYISHEDRPSPSDMMFDGESSPELTPKPRGAWASPDRDSPESPSRMRSAGGEHSLLRGEPEMHSEGGHDRPNAARADNILCAVLALIKELDGQGLELVRRAIEQRQFDM